MIIIGITGTLGAGKGTVAEYLIARGFSHYSGREFLLKEVAARGLPPDRDSTTLVANELRAAHGTEYIARTLYERARAAGMNAIIESIRTLGELKYLRSTGNFYLIAVDADPHTRYERIRTRGTSLDNVTFKQFAEQEAREMHSSDPTKQNVAAVIKEADFLITNSGTRAELEQATGLALETIRKEKY